MFPFSTVNLYSNMNIRLSHMKIILNKDIKVKSKSVFLCKITPTS